MESLDLWIKISIIMYSFPIQGASLPDMVNEILILSQERRETHLWTSHSAQMDVH